MKTTEMHLPFHNYAGPGTHVLTRILRGDEPINYIDAAALIHDIEYTGNVPQQTADTTMERNIAKYNGTMSAFAIDLIFKIKDIFGYSPPRNPKIYHYMKRVCSKLLVKYPKMSFSSHHLYDTVGYPDEGAGLELYADSNLQIALDQHIHEFP